MFSVSLRLLILASLCYQGVTHSLEQRNIPSTLSHGDEATSLSVGLARRMSSDSTRGRNDEDDDAVSVDGVQLVQCSANLREFASYISVAFDGNEENFDNCEKSLLERGFINTYRFLMGQRCDGFFRTIDDDDVKLNIRPMWMSKRRRDLQGVNATENSVPYGSSFFDVRANCRNCPVTDAGSFNLFNDAFRRLMMVKAADTGNGHGNILQNQEEKNKERHLQNYDSSYEDDDDHYTGQPMDTCECPAGTVAEQGDDYFAGQEPEIGPDAPDIETFRRTYNGLIEYLRDKCLIYSVSEATNMEEFARPPQRPRYNVK